jgi:hypothetical protein
MGQRQRLSNVEDGLLGYLLKVQPVKSTWLATTATGEILLLLEGAGYGWGSQLS